MTKNKKSGTDVSLFLQGAGKEAVQDSNEELAKELADIIHYTVAIAAINDIDLTKTIFEKDKKAAIKYQHERDLEGYLEAEGQN